MGDSFLWVHNLLFDGRQTWVGAHKGCQYLAFESSFTALHVCLRTLNLQFFFLPIWNWGCDDDAAVRLQTGLSGGRIGYVGCIGQLDSS